MANLLAAMDQAVADTEAFIANDRVEAEKTAPVKVASPAKATPAEPPLPPPAEDEDEVSDDLSDPEDVVAKVTNQSHQRRALLKEPTPPCFPFLHSSADYLSS